ncbi:MAG: hypothetical protein ACYDAN_10290, partial [Candidatus Limnocylindrales bacterium]
MFDIIGKRNWFFAISLAVLIPGLIFILAGPFTGGKMGLQFSIDFTGGTVWQIQFADPKVTPDQVKAVIAQAGYDAQVTEAGNGQTTRSFMEIRTKDAALAAPPATPAPVASASPSSSAGASAGASASAGTSASAGASGSAAPSSGPSASSSPVASASAAPSSSPSAAPSSSPSASASASAPASPGASAAAASPGASAAAASPGASVAPSPSPSVATTVCGGLPQGASRLPALCNTLEAKLGPISSQNSLTSVGAVVSSDLITQALVLILVGSVGILLWITYRFRDFRMGVTALTALLHDIIVVVGLFAILGTFFNVQI